MPSNAKRSSLATNTHNAIAPSQDHTIITIALLALPSTSLNPLPPTTRHPPPSLPHPLKLLDQRLLHLLIPSPGLAHLLHPQHSNNRETSRAERRPLLTDCGVRRDADFFEQAEVGRITIEDVSRGRPKVMGWGSTYHWLYISTCIKNHLFVHTSPFRNPSSLSQRARRNWICFARPLSSPSWRLSRASS